MDPLTRWFRLSVLMGASAFGIAGCRAHYIGSYEGPSEGDADGVVADAGADRASYADAPVGEFPGSSTNETSDGVVPDVSDGPVDLGVADEARDGARDAGDAATDMDASAVPPEAGKDADAGDAPPDGDASGGGDASALADAPSPDGDPGASDGDASLDAGAAADGDASEGGRDSCSMASLPAPVAYYSFDDCVDDRIALRDSTPSMNDGEKRGRVGCVPGHRGSAVFIDGAGTPKGYVNVPDAPEFRFTDQMTVSAWVSVLHLQYGHILSKWYFPDTFLLIADVDLFHFSFAVPSPTDSGVPWTSVDVFAPMKLHTWVHLAGVFDRGVVRFYVDGTNDTDGGFNSSSTTVLQNSDRPIQIGALTDEPVTGLPVTQTFSGFVDDVRIYNVALTACQIRALAAP